MVYTCCHSFIKKFKSSFSNTKTDTYQIARAATRGAAAAATAATTTVKNVS